MCLIFSLQGVIKVKGKNDGTKLFEEISGKAVENYLGGNVTVLGFPTQKTLSNQITDFLTSSFEDKGILNVKPTDKDKGVDIIAWLPHKDNRSNQIILLLQCAAGFNWNQKKTISVRAWRDLINWSAEPIEGIILPIVVNQDEWKKVRDDYHLIIDRIRILKSIVKMPKKDKQLDKKVIAWCLEQLN